MFLVPKSKEANTLKPFWVLSAVLPLEVCTAVFRSYREVGGSPPVQSVAALVEVPTPLKRKIKIDLNMSSS